MSTQTAVAVAPHRFAFGFYRQVWWNWLIGSAFFLGGVGGGLFVISYLTHNGLGMLVGYLIVVGGKNTAHLLYLGRPERFWRAAMRPDRSWIARGIWATGLFSVGGFFCWLPYFMTSWQSPEWLGRSAATVAIVAALFIMFYDGFVMNQSRGVAFWNSNLLPLLVLVYAVLGGTTLSLTLRELSGMEGGITDYLARAEHVLLVMNFLVLCFYVWRMSRWMPAARETARSLLSGNYARAFLGLVLAVGIGATLLLSIVHDRVQANWLVILIAACELTGDFSLLMVLLRSGLFGPQTAPKYAPASRVGFLRA
jgi:formate-dependent nitrite reductase membrane component NrfD